MDDFAAILYVRQLPDMTAAVRVEVDRMRFKGNDVGAVRLMRAWDIHKVELLEIEAAIAVKGTEILRRQERTSRVRPDTLGQGGARLGDHLHADGMGSILPGSVGIANESELDAEVPWWETNEVGSSARVGGVLYGLFQQGDSVPATANFRSHALFEPLKTGGGGGVIRNPIPARRFIRDALPEIRAIWRAAFDASRQTFEDEMTAAQLLGVAP